MIQNNIYDSNWNYISCFWTSTPYCKVYKKINHREAVILIGAFPNCSKFYYIKPVDAYPR